MSATQDVAIVCPICKQETVVKLPVIVLENKSKRLKRVQVDAGICCEHSFLIFLDSTGRVFGYENIDTVAIQTQDIGKNKIFLPDIIATYGDTHTILLLHAIIIKCPVVLLVSNPDSHPSFALNEFFNKTLPSSVKSPFLINAFSEESAKEKDLEAALEITENGEIQNIPWPKVPLLVEEQILNKALDMLDQELQIEVIKTDLQAFFDKCFFMQKKFKEWEQADRIYARKLGNLHEFKKRIIYEHEVEEELREHYGETISDDEIALVIQTLRERFKEDLFKTESIRKESISEKMPKKKKKRFFS